MRVVIFAVCTLIALGVFVGMFVAIWHSRRTRITAARFSQTITEEFVWATIPWLICIAAAIPAAALILHWRHRS